MTIVSDYPHPEGLADPVSFADEIANLPPEVKQGVMSQWPDPGGSCVIGANEKELAGGWYIRL